MVLALVGYIVGSLLRVTHSNLFFPFFSISHIDWHLELYVADNLSRYKLTIVALIGVLRSSLRRIFLRLLQKILFLVRAFTRHWLIINQHLQTNGKSSVLTMKHTCRLISTKNEVGR